MGPNKIAGYVLLAVGLLIIVGTLWQSYNIFTVKSAVPAVFLVPISVNSINTDNSPTAQAIKKQIAEVISPETITKLLNLSAWGIFAGILILGGGVISRIGVKLIYNGTR